ncbi:SOS response-associated peptidase [Paenibacillus abyssi]|uniref:Abasic site processing protein n=1 Tax=Paenibacillus abyssi TaxID=1340531 RepID=A0A917FZ78_9BACL|nr:SOS response-associated peptidase [Paenibacillus abyssi]GGG14916.1 putative SOS response-associated peptidase YoqW [Paenibacillus abyssi]
MCERFSLTVDSAQLQEQFDINKVMCDYNQRYNISPTQSVPVIVGGRRERKLVDARWGLFPFWAKDSVNADFDSVSGKKIFDRILKKQRCVIPCSGFYGWRTEGKVSYAVRIVLRDQQVFAMAGLYEERVDPRGALHRSCTIVTTMPNRVVSDYHDRMPVILDEQERENWLNPEITDKKMLENHIYAYPASLMRAYPVTPLLRNEQLETPEVIKEFAPHLAMLKE